MATKAQKVRLSIFLIASSVILLIFFLVLVGSRLFRKMDPYHVVYEGISVTGLEPGAAVKYHGVQVGRVTGLSVKDVGSIQVDIQVEHDTPIKTDTKATVEVVGITGLKYVELSGGSPDSDFLEIGNTIGAGQSLFDTITGSAEVILAKLELVLNNLNVMLGPETTVSLQNALDSVSRVTSNMDTLLTDNRLSLTNSMAHLDTVMIQLAVSSKQISEIMTSINSIMQSNELKNTVSNVNHISERLKTQLDSLNIAETNNELRDLLANTNQMVVHYDLIGLRARNDILNSLSNLEEALNNLREATDVIRENPSVLLRGRQTTGDRIE
ncbi:MAG: MCE family protein [Candidatus Latescibacteria bacterium]|nr:MCE family protein [Candidatus Latescibacterota bacterium]